MDPVLLYVVKTWMPKHQTCLYCVALFDKVPLTFFSHQQIMKDKWINAGYDGEELKPHSEPVEDLNDTNRIGKKDSPLTFNFLT